MGKGIGGFLSGIFGSENEYDAKADEYQVDANAYEYGGAPGGADAAANKMGARADHYAGQQEHFMGRGNSAMDASGNSRYGQQAVAEQMARRAGGQVPSIAQMQGDRAMQQAAAAQASQAASARGPAAMALAQQNAAANVANTQSNIAGQTQIAAAQERLAAEQAAMGAFSQMRSSDQGDAGLAFGAAGQAGQLGLGASAQEQGIRNSQLSAGMNREAQRSGNAANTQGTRAGVSGQNASMNQQNSAGLMGAAGDTAGAVVGMLSDARAKMGIASPSALTSSKPSAGEAKAEASKPGVGDILSGFGSSMHKLAGSVDTRYQGGGGGYVPPHLLQVSDVRAKDPIAQQMANPSHYKLSGAGMDVMGTLHATNEAIRDAMRSPGSQGFKQPMPSDVTGKSPAGVLDLYDHRTRIGADDRGFLAREDAGGVVPAKYRAALETADGGSSRPAAAAAAPKAKSGARKPTLDEAERWADAELARTRRDTEALDKARPAADPMADAARAMRASVYAYKPEMTPPEQQPGEPNVGPMAQSMAADPIAATAVKRDPETGLLMIDQSKMMKVLGGVVASQQEQLDELRRKKGG